MGRRFEILKLAVVLASATIALCLPYKCRLQELPLTMIAYMFA